MGWHEKAGCGRAASRDRIESRGRLRCGVRLLCCYLFSLEKATDRVQVTKKVSLVDVKKKDAARN